MVTGITGEGKSSACNFLLGKELIKVSLSSMAVISKTDSPSKVLQGREIKIIDTPGFCEDSEDDETNIKELGKAVVLAKTGVHAIALVINVQPVSHRFTSSQVALLKELELLDNLWSFMFIIFSAAKSYGATDEEQRKRIKTIYDSPKCPEDFKKLLDRVEKRFMMLESTETNQDYRDAKLKEFLNMVDGIYHTNKRLYSNELFEQAIKMYQEVKDKEKNKEKERQEAKIKAKALEDEERERREREEDRQRQITRANEEMNRQLLRRQRSRETQCNLS